MIIFGSSAAGQDTPLNGFLILISCAVVIGRGDEFPPHN